MCVKICEYKSCREKLGLQVWCLGFGLIHNKLGVILIQSPGFKTIELFQLRVFSFINFQLHFSQHFWTELQFWPKENLYRKSGATTLVFEVLSKTQQIFKYKLLNIVEFLGRFWNSVLFCIWLFPFNFSPISSTQLQKFSKTKLLGFENYKTLLKTPRAESC